MKSAYQGALAVIGSQEFEAHCHTFAYSKESALVEIGRGNLSALIKDLNTVQGLQLESPSTKLTAAGSRQERFQPRARVLQETDLPALEVSCRQTW